MKYLAVALLSVVAFLSQAADRKAYQDISINALTADTQSQPENAGDNHLALVWWVPYEYWASVFSRDPNLNDRMRESMLGILKQYTVVAVVQADISPLGAFNFYDKATVESNMVVSYQEDGKEAKVLLPETDVDADMVLLMSQVGPVLQAAMGNMGSNFHFYIYSDQKDGKRVVDPYSLGNLNVTVGKKDGVTMEVAFEAPLDSLFIPRICPNGKKAHISWQFCPWSGEKISD